MSPACTVRFVGKVFPVSPPAWTVWGSVWATAWYSSGVAVARKNLSFSWMSLLAPKLLHDVTFQELIPPVLGTP